MRAVWYFIGQKMAEIWADIKGNRWLYVILFVSGGGASLIVGHFFGLFAQGMLGCCIWLAACAAAWRVRDKLSEWLSENWERAKMRSGR